MKRNQLIAIGALVTVAIALVVQVLIFLHPRPGDGKTKVRVRFQNIDKIAEGSRVAFAGGVIGEVQTITVLATALATRPFGDTVIYPYELLLALDSKVNIYPTDIITVKTSGLMGERCVSITPKPMKLNSSHIVTIDDILYAQEPPGIEDAVQNIASITEKAEQALTSTTAFIHSSQAVLDNMVHSFQQTTHNFDVILQQLDATKIIPQLSDTIQTTNSILSQIQDGKGSLGLFINRPQIYQEALLCTQKARFLMDSLTTYGLFFHTHSQWQRQRMQIEKTGVIQELSLDKK